MSLADWTLGGAEFDITPGGAFDPTFRFYLWRERPQDLLSTQSRRRLGVCMHNPSAAGADPVRENDPTIRRLCGFADRWGFSRFDVINLGDRVATDPRDFYKVNERFRVSPACDRAIRDVARNADVFLVAWGRLDRAWAQQRAREVLALINRPVVCIRKLPGCGDPQHPVRATYTDAPVLFKRAA